MRTKKFYITTPPYCASGKPHLGHAYTTLAADILARHLRTRDIPVYLQTGTGEHCPGIEETAKGRNMAPGDWCDAVSADFRALWKTLNIKYDQFARTSDRSCADGVQAVFEKLLKSGDIRKAPGAGLYCPACEAFYGEADLKGKNCPVHGRPAQPAGGEVYFFRLSGYKGALLRHYAKHPDFLSPSGRAQELVNSVKAGLTDVSVSSFGAARGLPVISDPGQTIHSWFGALLNYAVGPGYSPDRVSPDFQSLWPADVHLADRGNFRLHGVIWPALLLALGLELPRKVYAHGWWMINGGKMSRSKGNFIKAEDVVRDYGVDALRYFLFREVPFGQDGEFSAEALRRRYNSDLAGELGHLFSRLMHLSGKYLEHRLPRKPEGSEIFKELSSWTQEIHSSTEALRFSDALEMIWRAVGRLNRLIDERKPWEMEKQDPAALRPFLHEMVWCLRLVAGWLDPYMPDTASKMHLQLGVGLIPGGVEPQNLPALFPRKHDGKPGDPLHN